VKHWRIILVTFLAFVPLALFAAVQQYQNPLCGSVNSLPQFIKGVLTIVVKVGIPIATIFIVWSGFLFLTAQGDETKLTKAKHSFVWACIGTAVLLGAWLLATAINATIQSLGGGTNGGGSGTTIDGGCTSTPPPPITKLTIPPIPPHDTQNHESVPAACIGGGGSSGAWVMERAFREYWERSSWVSGEPVPTTDVNYGSVGNNTEDCLYEQGVYMTKIQANRVPNEQGWFYVLDGNGNNQWKSVGNGTNINIEVPMSNYWILLHTSAYSIVSFHTHPAGGLKNTKGQTIPSSADIFSAARRNSAFGPQVLSRVSDGAIDLSRPDAPYTVWAYTATNASPFISLTKTGIEDGWNTFVDGVEDMANNQDDPKAELFIKEFEDKYSIRAGIHKTDEWINAVWSSLNAAGNGTYGPTIANMAKVYAQKIADTPLYAWWDTYRTCTTSDDQTNKMLEIYRNNGVTVTEEQHPYLSCVVSP
jgi:hypothetical protein